ncbi:uncharacterized protein [Euwallacea similis]|uniref:uncharacterized protein n=1 Tax=Euwallacea similis TaxID=1736056 RepID=UPI00344B0601
MHVIKMNLWIFLFATALLATSIMVLGTPVTNIPVCSMQEMRLRVRQSCGQLKRPSDNFGQRSRRSYSVSRIEISEPRYYFRMKRDEIIGICCPPSLIKLHGSRCVEKYTC